MYFYDVNGKNGVDNEEGKMAVIVRNLAAEKCIILRV